VWLEDLSGTLEVVIWNETYVKVANVLTPGAVVAMEGTLDTRDDAVRATAQKVLALSPDAKNGAATPIVLRFPPGTPSNILRDVRDLLASSPGKRVVLLQIEQPGRPAVQIAAGLDCRIDLTPELERKLQPWLPAA
jgi:DNA polymerase-3 subunit alpha